MGSLACNGCSQLVFVNDKQLTELKIHMIDTHKFVNKVNSVINIAFLNEAEEAHLDRLLQPRIRHFLETGNLHPTNVNLFERGSEKNDESEIPDIDESISDDEDDDLGEDELAEVQDMLLEHKLLEKLKQSVAGNSTGNEQRNSDLEKPVELNEKYLENLMAKLREDGEEESDVDVKGGEEDNDSDSNPFSPEKSSPSRETSNNPDLDYSAEEIQYQSEIGKKPEEISSTAPNRPLKALELQMSTPTSLAPRELAASTLKTQVKIEKTIGVDVIVDEVAAKNREQAAGGFLKREAQEQPPSDFCRLCYCRFNLFLPKVLRC